MKKRTKESLKVEGYEMIWCDEPTNYEYVRESNYICASPRYIPKVGKTIFRGYAGSRFKENKDSKYIEKKGAGKLIGYSKPEYVGNHLYKGIYFWLKSYDVGMSDEKLGYGHPNNPKWYRPCEAVEFVKLVKPWC